MHHADAPDARCCGSRAPRGGPSEPRAGRAEKTAHDSRCSPRSRAEGHSDPAPSPRHARRGACDHRAPRDRISCAARGGRRRGARARLRSRISSRGTTRDPLAERATGRGPGSTADAAPCRVHALVRLAPRMARVAGRRGCARARGRICVPRWRATSGFTISLRFSAPYRPRVAQWAAPCLRRTPGPAGREALHSRIPVPPATK